MGDMADDALYKAGLAFLGPPTADGFDAPTGPAEEFECAGSVQVAPVAPKDDPLRPQARRGRYYLPNPVSGKTKSWQRVTNFVKMTDDTYHLELWKQRNVAKGVAALALTRPGFIEDLAQRDVKADKDRLNEIVTRAMDVAEAYRMAEAGTELHKATELADHANGDLNRVPVEYRDKVRLYLDALAVHGITVVPGMIERLTVSDRYEVAGTFDRVYRLGDGSNVIGDLKTGDSLDLSFPSIAAQLDCYRDGINRDGVFDGQRYDKSIKVRNDFGIVVHLPSTRNEVTVYAVDLTLGAQINAANLTVKQVRQIKAKHVSTVFDVTGFGMGLIDQDSQDDYWLEQMNGVYTRDQLVGLAERARYFGQWNERLADQARIVAAELAQQVRR